MKVQISDIYYTSILNPTLFDIIMFKLSKRKHWIFKFITLLMYDFNFKNVYTDKIYKTNTLNNISVKSRQDGCSTWNHANEVHLTKPFTVYTVKTINHTLNCADNHMLYVLESNNRGIWKFAKDILVGEYIMSDSGKWEMCTAVYANYSQEYMFDLSVTEESHSYITNGLLSHNTTSTCCFLLHRLLFTNDLTTLVVANKKETALEIIGKLKQFMEGLPYFLKPGIVLLKESRIRFENGSSIKAAATSKTPATGDSIKLLYMDEAAVIPPNIIDEFWASVQPTMSSFRGSQIIMTSTPRGKGNLFYRTYSGAIEGTNGFKHTRVDWWEVPGRDAEWEKQQRIELGDEMFNREFGLSFESSTSRLLSAYYINFTNRIKKTFVSHELYNVPKEISSKIFWHPDFDPGSLTYYDCLRRYFLFVVDTAEGLEKGAAGKKDSDYNVINIFEIKTISPSRIERNRRYSNAISIKDVISLRQVGIYMDNQKDEEECAEAAKCLAFQVFKAGYQDIDNVRILVEMNFNGKNWVNKFKAHPGFYEPLIIKCPRGISASTDNQKLDYGFKTTGGKHGKNYYCELGGKLMDKLQIIIQQNNDEQPVCSSLFQLLNFGKNTKGSYEGTCVHDDISVTCLFASIAFEQQSFQQWCEEWLEVQEQTENIQKIQYMLNTYVETEPTVSDEEFSTFFNSVSSHLNQGLRLLQNTYSALRNNAGNNNYNNMMHNIRPSMPMNPYNQNRRR